MVLQSLAKIENTPTERERLRVALDRDLAPLKVLADFPPADLRSFAAVVTYDAPFGPAAPKR